MRITKIILLINLFLLASSGLNAQTQNWQKIIQHAKLSIRYYAPEKTERFEYMNEKSSTDNGRACCKTYEDRNLTIRLTYLFNENHILVNGDVESLKGNDECFTLRVEFPVAASEQIIWNGNLGSSSAVEKKDSTYDNYVEISTVMTPRGGFNTIGTSNGGYNDKVGTGFMSFYPLASISTPEAGLAWGIDMGLPIIYRLAFNQRLGMTAEFDLAISKQTRKFPGTTFFKMQLFEHDPFWKMRSALEKYYSLNKSYFDKKVGNEGIWLPFTPLNTIENFQDFGFAFHETSWKTKDKGLADSLPTILADKAAGVYSFQYTEPWDIQIPISDLNMDYKKVTEDTTVIPNEFRPSLQNAAALDKDNRLITRRLEAPWFHTNWAVSVTTNCDPEIKSMNRYEYVRGDEVDPAIKLDVDGIYFDSMEWNWHHDLNYNTDHFMYADYPLTFSSSVDKIKPAIWNYSSEYDMMSQIAREMHMKGKYTMGNGFAWMPFAPGVLDLFGAEFSWYSMTDYDDRILQFRRAISNQKPIVFLLNEGFDDKAFTEAPYDGYRQYFERMLFYGFFPSFFSADASSNPYWANKTKYNQGRPYFKKYIPLIKRVASAGWEPVTCASASKNEISVERFGKDLSKGIYFTLMNTGKTSAAFTLNVNTEQLKLNEKSLATELVTGLKLKTGKSRDGKTLNVSLEIPAGSTRLVALTE